MKTPNINSSDLPNGRRAQPPRQTRTNPPRSLVPGSRSFGSRGSLGALDGPSSLDQAIEIFPAIIHFADAITALPKEIVRHFTLLKEVDAKVFAPEEDLAKLVDAALSAPLPDQRQPLEAHHALGPTSAPMSAKGSANGSVINGHIGSVASVPEELYNSINTAYDSANIPRRQLFQHCAYTMQNMLVSLDEKNHVISTAAEALSKQLARIDDCFPYIELEVSEEARYGSVTHWAYPENRATKHASSSGSRRELAATNTLTAAAQHLVDEAAARSDARKQALLAKKNNKHQTESDFDDPHEKHKESSKKIHGNSKVRKAVDASVGVGLGITNGAGTNGTSAKRRKVEKGPAGGAVMERALSSVFGSNGAATKGKGGSPRETPGPDGSKKRSRAALSMNGQSGRKRYLLDRHFLSMYANVPIRNNTVTSVAISPSLASSPTRTTFSESKMMGRVSPAPTNAGRPASSRARQNSTQSVVEPVRQSSVRANGVITPDLRPAAEATGRTMNEVKSIMKETATNLEEHLLEDIDNDDAEMIGGILVGNRKDSTMKREDTETNGESMQGVQITTVTTKSGRASKPATPAIPQFPEPLRSRSSRSALEAASINKRSHKKGAGAAAQQQQLLAQQNMELDDGASDMQGDDEDGDVADEDADPNEPRYCYCNGVSFGEMVGCDSDNCEREWFHLPCVGLKVAPKGNGELFLPKQFLPPENHLTSTAKWYCDDCKEKLKLKRFNSR